MYTQPAAAPLPSLTAGPNGLPATAQPVAAGPAAVAHARARKPATSRGVIGFVADVGVPDGITFGLAVAPFSWARLTGSVASNTASIGFRGGLTLMPLGFGPSFTFEAGHFGVADANAAIRYVYSVPNWVKPYFQQFGYTFLNGHVGFDYSFGGLTLFIHGGVSYMMATLRSPQPVVIDTNNRTQVTFKQDGDVTVWTLSGKIGLMYLFGGSS